MRLPFLRKPDPTHDRASRPAATDNAAVVAVARARARRRLSGALVLLIVAVVGFPLLFETQPRPLPVDTPIAVRSREPLVAAVPEPSRPTARAAGVPADASVITEPAEPSPAVVAAVPSTTPSTTATTSTTTTPAPATATTPPVAAPATASKEPPRDAVKEPAPPPRPPRDDDGARARALLEARATAGASPTPSATPAAAATPGAAEVGARYVVQVGAYSDAGALRDARQRVERLGLKTYTQVVEVGGGRRTTRVRIGPYASRDEAGAAATRVKNAGLPAAVLTL